MQEKLSEGPGIKRKHENINITLSDIFMYTIVTVNYYNLPMKQVLPFFFFFLLLSDMAFSQDMIVRKNGDTVLCKILEVDNKNEC